MRIAFKTFGCKANSVETDVLYQRARSQGFEIVGENEIADAYVINSCTVTHAADRDSRNQAIRFKRKNPKALVGIVGCYPQVTKEELLNLPEIDFVVGNSDKSKILESFSQSWKGMTVAKDQVKTSTGFLSETFTGSRHSRASLKIQEGCNFSCTFCIVHKARGRSKSLAIQKVLTHIEEAYQQGFQEVILTGIHIAHYGWDQGTNLTELLKAIFAKARGPRIRLSTLDPFEIEDEWISLLSLEPRFCPHFHISLQSGSNRILSEMRRTYKAEVFVEVIRKIKERSLDAFIGVDVLVGFPGETEEDFNQTVECLKRSYWTKLHVFPFSPRRGTPAAEMTNQVPDFEITNRSRLLRDWSEQQLNTFMQSQLGKTFDVLIEKPSRKMPGLWQGHTENYLPTYSSVLKHITSKQIVPSRVTKIDAGRLITEPIMT